MAPRHGWPTGHSCVLAFCLRTEQCCADTETSSSLSKPLRLSFASFDQLHGVVLLQGVVKDDPSHPRQPGGVPVVRIGFQEHVFRTQIGGGDTFHQLIWACTPRTRHIEDSPILLPPAEVAMKLTVAHMQHGEPCQRSAIWFGKVEVDGVRVNNL